MKILVKCLAVLYLGILNESTRMNGYVIIMLVFRNCPHRSSVSRVIRKLKYFLYFLSKSGCCPELLAKLLLKPKLV